MKLFMVMLRTPNPMYILSGRETAVLTDIYMREHGDLSNVYVGSTSFAILPKLRSLGTRLVRAMLSDIRNEAESAQKIILNAGFLTTLKTPHHIHENGDGEDQPGREGPIRTYFDGSHINNLGHVVAISIDKEAQCITTQCPWGNDFPEPAENILRDVFPNFDRVTLRAKQQKDLHSCGPLTLYNIFSMAGIHEAKVNIDIQAWRSELLEKLEAFEVVHGAIKQKPEAACLEEYGHLNPVFHQRYI